MHYWTLRLGFGNPAGLFWTIIQTSNLKLCVNQQLFNLKLFKKNSSKTYVYERVMSVLGIYKKLEGLGIRRLTSSVHLTTSSMQVFKVMYLATLQVIGCLRSKDQLHQLGEVVSACIHLSSRSIPANIDQGCRRWYAYHRKLLLLKEQF